MYIMYVSAGKLRKSSASRAAAATRAATAAAAAVAAAEQSGHTERHPNCQGRKNPSYPSILHLSPPSSLIQTAVISVYLYV